MASILLLILFGKNYTQVWKNKEFLVSDSKIFDYPVCTLIYIRWLHINSWYLMVFSQNYCYYFLQVAPLMCSLAIMCIQQYGKAGYKIYFPDLKKKCISA